MQFINFVIRVLILMKEMVNIIYIMSKKIL